jgi:hypothetical protein
MDAFDKRQLEQIAEDVAAIKILLTGNGHPETGVIVRLDRVEQREKSRTWMIHTALATTITLIIGGIYKFFVKG